MNRATSRSLWLICLLTFSLVGLSSCFDDDEGPEDGSSAQQQELANEFFDDAITQFDIKVFYEEGAEPYVGALGANDTWDVTKDSFAALFQNHPGRTVTAPSTLSTMEEFDSRSELYWSSNELFLLVANLGLDFKSGTVIRPAVVFVNGYFGASADVLGIHLTGYPFAFIFKDAIKAVGGTGIQQRYIEQSVIVHELGHAIGLTNYGVPMVSNHEDNAHPRHSTDANCVMYWKVDSGANVLSHIAPYVLGSQLVLFGTKTLQDGRAYHP